MFLFSINEGEIFGLIGPNGAGKTTMFNMITNMFSPTSGEIIFMVNRSQELNLIKLLIKDLPYLSKYPPFFANDCIRKYYGWRALS